MAVLPFDLFPRQAEYLTWRDACAAAGEGGLVEKSRDMGVTWLNVAWQVHRWLFVDGHKGTFGSRKEMLVDASGNPDSIFAKARFILDHLPWWMLPRGWDRKKCSQHMLLVNPANMNTLTGEAGDNMGRGGRSTVYDVDEHAHVERAQSVEAAISANSNVIFRTSTPRGTGNPFHDLRHGGTLPVFTFHWRDDPRKGEAWYARQLATLDPIIVAQELDIDYAASIEGILIPRGWLTPCVGRALYPIDREAHALGVDVARFGTDDSAMVLRRGRNLLHAETWHGNDTEATAGRVIAYAKGIQGKLYILVDATGVGAGVADKLRAYVRAEREAGRMPFAWTVIDINVGERSVEERCYRLRDSLWWRAREFFRTREPAFAPAIPREAQEKLISQLCAPLYSFSPEGLIRAESKDDMKKRKVKSPDLADALIHTFHFEAMEPRRDERPEWQKARPASSGYVA